MFKNHIPNPDLYNTLFWILVASKLGVTIRVKRKMREILGVEDETNRGERVGEKDTRQM